MARGCGEEDKSRAAGLSQAAVDPMRNTALPAFEEIPGFLSTTRLFGALNQEELRAVSAHLKRVTFDAGETLFRAGEVNTNCYLMYSGRASISGIDRVGEEVIFDDAGPGDAVGERTFLYGTARSTTVRATEPVVAFAMESSFLTDLRQHHPALALELNRQIEERAVRRFLRESSPFMQLPDSVLDRLQPRLTMRSVPRGAVLVSEGDAPGELCMLFAGKADVSHRGKTERVLEVGNCFGESALLTDRRRTSTVRAIDPTTLLVLSKADFDEVVGGEPEIAAHLAELRRISGHAGSGLRIALPHLSTLMPFITAHKRRAYYRVFGIGALATIVLGLLYDATAMEFLMRAALLVGSVVIPVTYVTFIAESQYLPSQQGALLAAFLFAGVFGYEFAAMGNQFLPSLHIRPIPIGTAFQIGLIEEGAKVLAVVIFMSSMREFRFRIDGLMFGAAAGMGFEALENFTYALDKLRPDTASAAVGVMTLRALLSPLGHGTWTAIVCAAIWSRRSDGWLRALPLILAAFACSVTLHAMWDYTLTYGAILVIGFIGLWILEQIFRRSLRDEVFSILALNPRLADLRTSRTGVQCHVCAQDSIPGSTYCVRCGAALRRA